LALVPRDRAILFADVADSMRMYEQFGDKRAAGMIDACIETMSHLVSEWRGFVVKTIGDEIMACFSDATSACEAARAMQLAITNTPSGVSQLDSLALRIGFHFGSVLEGNMDYLGDTVNTSARLTSLARRGQILTTASTIHHLSSALRAGARDLDALDLRGKHEPIRVYEIPWYDDVESTMVATRPRMSPTEAEPKLALRAPGRNLELLDATRPIWLGRDIGCEMVVREKMASRRHARVERRGSRFYLVDESTNGTYVTLADGSEIHLRLEALPLQGSGLIGLGAPTREATDPVAFSA
jgi:adenylate cyclase